MLYIAPTAPASNARLSLRLKLQPSKPLPPDSNSAILPLGLSRYGSAASSVLLTNVDAGQPRPTYAMSLLSSWLGRW